MSPRVRAAAWGGLMLAAVCSTPWSPSSFPDSAAVLSTSAALLALSPQEAARRQAVRLIGVVTCYDPDEGVLFVQDATGGALIDTLGLDLSLRSGQRAEVEGVSEARGGLPLVVNPRVRVLGEAPMPPARRVLASHLKGRSGHHEWIEFQGRIALFDDGERRRLVVHEYRDFLRVHVHDLRGSDPASLVGPAMRLQGVFGPTFGRDRQPTGHQLWVPSTAYVTRAQPAAGATAPVDRDLPKLTRIDRIRQLSPQEAARGHPVTVRGVVTYYDAEWCMLFVQDASGGIYVQCRSHEFPLATGQLVEVEGVTGPGEYSPIIDQPRVRLLGEASLPAALTLNAEQLAYGSGEALWIAVRGVVQSVHRVGELHAGFLLALDGGRTQVTVPDVRELPLDLIGARARFRGIGLTIFNKKRQLLGSEVLSPSMAYVQREEPAPPDLFAVPVQALGSLLQFRSGNEPTGRHRVQGIVTHQRPGGSFYITDRGDGLYVETTQPLTLQPGDRVDVLGFPALGEYAPRFRGALVRKLGGAPPPEAAPITAEQGVSGDYDGALVRIDGRLLDRTSAGGNTVLIVQAPPFAFEATLEGDDGRMAQRLRSGSVLRLTGICSVQVDERQVPRSFRVLLRSPSDVVVLQSAPWWTRRHTLWALGVLAVTVPAALGWAGLLKRQVRLRTDALRHHSAVLEERSRIARELHDSLDQGFWGILLQLEAASEGLEQAGPTARAHVELARSLVRHCQAEAHRSVWDLRSWALDRADLTQALAATARLVALSSSASIDTRVVGTPRALSESVENNLLRIGQEALTNAARHAGARAIVAELRFEPGRVRLVVRDDGTGFDVDSAALGRSGHFGLIGMRERAKRIGGRLTIQSAPGHGATVAVELADGPEGAA